MTQIQGGDAATGPGSVHGGSGSGGLIPWNICYRATESGGARGHHDLKLRPQTCSFSGPMLDRVNSQSSFLQAPCALTWLWAFVTSGCFFCLDQPSHFAHLVNSYPPFTGLSHQRPLLRARPHSLLGTPFLHFLHWALTAYLSSPTLDYQPSGEANTPFLSVFLLPSMGPGRVDGGQRLRGW